MLQLFVFSLENKSTVHDVCFCVKCSKNTIIAHRFDDRRKKVVFFLKKKICFVW